MNSKHTYWELSIRQFFDNWKDLKTPLQNPEHFKKPQQEKKLLTIDEIKPQNITKNQQPEKKKRGRPKKKAI